MAPIIITLEGMADRIPPEVERAGIVELRDNEPWFWKLLSVDPHADIKIILPKELSDEDRQQKYDRIEMALASYKIAYHTEQLNMVAKQVNAQVNHNAFLECTPVHELDVIFNNHTALIIGNGPSLDNSLRIDNGTTVFSCWHAVHKLLKKGIDPDYVVHADANTPVDDWQGPPPLTPSLTALIATPSVCAGFINRPYRHLYGYFSADSPMQHSFFAAHHNSPDHGPVGGTVVGMAIQSALYAGYEKIAIIGVDLSQPEPFEGSVQVQDKYNKPCHTSPIWLHYKEQLECLARLHPRVTFENWGTTGLALHGFKDVVKRDTPLIVVPSMRPESASTQGHPVHLS